MDAISVEHITKSYGDKIILNDLSFQVKQGTVFAMLGMNGAGKTTLLECMEKLRKIEKGTIQCNGSIGIQLQSSSLPNKIKVQEAIKLFGMWNKVTPTKSLIEQFGMTAFCHKTYDQISTGQKRRLHLALALLHNPDIIFLDEPTAGLDIEGRVQLHTIIRNLRDAGKTIVLASHDMAEVEQLSDEMIVLHHGTIHFKGTANAFKNRNQQSIQLHLTLLKPLKVQTFRHVSIMNQNELEYIFTCQNMHQALLEIMSVLEQQNNAIQSISSHLASLEDQFLNMLQED